MQCEVKDVQRVWGLFLQSSSLVVCEVDVGLQEKLKKFRFRKETNNAAILSESDAPSICANDRDFLRRSFSSCVPQ